MKLRHRHEGCGFLFCLHISSWAGKTFRIVVRLSFCKETFFSNALPVPPSHCHCHHRRQRRRNRHHCHHRRQRRRNRHHCHCDECVNLRSATSFPCFLLHKPFVFVSLSTNRHSMSSRTPYDRASKRRAIERIRAMATGQVSTTPKPPL